MLDWVTDPWTSALMRRAFLDAMLVGAVCGGLGCFVLVRGLAFLGESISHTVVLGVILAFLVGAPTAVGAVVLAAVTVLLSAAIANDRRFSVDTATGILLPCLFGAGVALIALSDGYRASLDDVLFGTVLAATDTDLALALGAALVIAALVLIAGKELALVAFDRSVAQAMGYRVALLDLLLLGAVALAVVVSLRAVGNVLLAGLLLGPPVTARMLCRTFWRMTACAASLGVAASIVGLYLSWYVEVGAGAAIVLVVAAGFVVVAVAVRLARRPGHPPPLVAALVVAGLAVGGCGSQEATSEGGKVKVVATTMQLQDFTRQVGGDRVEVSGILGPRDEPHEYEPTPKDADAVSEAKVVIANGAGLDEWLGDLLANADADAGRVTASSGIDLLPTDEEGFPGDPHVWHDPANAKAMVDNVATGLAKADPDGRATYQRNAKRYKGQIEAMARQIRDELGAIPPADRKLVTTHDAFGYFARAYDIDIVGAVLPSVTTETETSGKGVRELVDTIRDEKVKVIFTEAGVDPKLERQIAKEAGATVDTSLYADVLGPPGSGADEFIDAELVNSKEVATAFKKQ